ncbi:MAG: FAD-dependent monooxygenase [Defluviimonas sp.]|uniref:FAD-dependent monooxygenase n=1 Tax=Albidovulum sp. TaxID=1872424 RepID=UPI002A3507BF|nr:FAD-dependent monooxygenase [Defluviimonas sp.]
MLKDRNITVLGAGLAGLALARALALRGAAVTVLEQAAAIREVGAGLQISPNGARVLDALGLGRAAAEAGQAAEAIELCDGETGRRVVRLDLDPGGPEPDGFEPDGPHAAGTRAAGPRAVGRGPFRFFHRADLIGVLAEGARSAGVQIRLLQKVREVRLGAHPPRLVTETGPEIETDLLLGADGLHSRVRAALNGAAAPFFTGQVAWRAVIPADGPIDPVARVYMGPGRHLVTYPLRGGALRNIVAVEERRDWVEESWSLSDDPLALRIAFEKFLPEVRGWLDRVERPNLWGLFRHPVAERWHGQGAAILGDAAHPTLPFLAQGANMALEDAWVLARALESGDAAEAALAAYAAARIGRTRRIVDAATGNARNYHLSGITRDIAHLGLRMASRFAPGRLIGRYDWIYRHDVTEG